MTVTTTTLGERFVDLLRHFDQIINTTLREIVSDFSLTTLLVLFGISFIYGILHSIGPGHGKALIASYFLKEEHKLSKSLLLSALVSLIHTGAAIILAFLLFYVLTGIKGMFRIQLQSYFIFSSGIMITLIGLLFLGLKIFSRKKGEGEKKWEKRNFVLVAISAGIIPCPVSSMIMMLTIAHGAVHVGLISVFSISLGMFTVLSSVGLISILSRTGILKASEKVFNKTELVSKIIEYLSILFVIILGLSMVSSFFIISSGSPF